ncbi:MAG TPA: peptidase S11 [Chromatiales bacterium]|nr:peptidase S11 [Chromatiales bacterium]
MIALALFSLLLTAEEGGATDSKNAIAHRRIAKEQHPKLRSRHILVMDERGRILYTKDPDTAVPIASITKLMTAMVVLDAGVPLDKKIHIRKEDRDLIQLTGSRLHYGKATLSRKELLEIALIASENRAAAALGRTTFPGGKKAFIAAMNRKAAALGMAESHFVDPAGLDPRNVASARDLTKMIRAAYRYPVIRAASTTLSKEVRPYRKLGGLRFHNTNRLLRNKHWHIELSKTGYINESGRCLVMRARIGEQPLYIVLLNSYGKLTPFGDSNRLRKWMTGLDRTDKG